MLEFHLDKTKVYVDMYSRSHHVCAYLYMFVLSYSGKRVPTIGHTILEAV